MGFKRRLIATGYGTVKDTVYMDFNWIGVSQNSDFFQMAHRYQQYCLQLPGKEFPYPDLALVRDLHCWEIRLSFGSWIVVPTRSLFMRSRVRWTS